MKSIKNPHWFLHPCTSISTSISFSVPTASSPPSPQPQQNGLAFGTVQRQVVLRPSLPKESKEFSMARASVDIQSNCWTTWESRVKSKKSIFRSGLVLWLCFQKVWKNKGKWILTLDKYAFFALTRGNIQYLPRTQMTSCLIGKCLHLKTFQAHKIEDKQVSGRKIAGFGVKAPPFTFNTFRIEFWSHGKSCLPPSWPPIWKETDP